MGLQRVGRDWTTNTHTQTLEITNKCTFYNCVTWCKREKYTVARTWKQPRGPSAGWIRRMDKKAVVHILNGILLSY